MVPGAASRGVEAVGTRYRELHEKNYGRGAYDFGEFPPKVVPGAASRGVEAVGTRYRELHEKYYGRGAYDFGEFTLTSLAEGVARDQRDPATALALLDLNQELHPESAYTHVMKGRIQARTGARDDAIRSFERALELKPDNPWARQQLERLKAAPAGEKP